MRAKLIGTTVIIEDGCDIGDDVEIISEFIHIKRNSTIKNLKAHCAEKFILGECSYIGNRNIFTCKSFETGKYLWLTDDVEIGRGGSTGPNSTVKIGDNCMICEKVLLNPSEKIEIGDDVGIGTEVQIWTHGSYLNVLDGFPANFAPVSIGNHVWLPARNVVLPGVTIGNNCVIGLGSLINKNIPDGCLAGGIPIKVLKENAYPIELDPDKKVKIVNDILNKWLNEIVPYKNITTVLDIEYDVNSNDIKLYQTTGNSVLNITNHTIDGHNDEIVEDLRDFLRRNGIKIFTGSNFKSITPPIFIK